MQISRKLFEEISICDVFILITVIFEYLYLQGSVATQ